MQIGELFLHALVILIKLLNLNCFNLFFKHFNIEHECLTDIVY